MTDKLSIFIPTYNRSAKLGRTLALLENYNKKGISVYVLDNNSSDNTSEIVYKFIEKANFKIVYKKNLTNVGPNANIIRCIEYCHTEWVWILSDDDTPDEKCFKTINDYLTSSNTVDTCYINFSTTAFQTRKDNTTVVGLSDFFLKMDNFPNVLFISTCLFNSFLIKPNLRFAYNYTYSLAPYLVALFYTLKENNFKAIFSKDKIVDFEAVSENNQKWSYFNLFLGVSSLFEISDGVDDEIMRQFVRKICAYVIIDKQLFLYILKYYHNKPFLRRYIYNQIVLRNIFYYPKKGILFYSKLIFWGIILNSNFITRFYLKKTKFDLFSIDFGTIQPLNNRL